MIASAHRFTAFWFESEADAQRVIEESASRFLAASLDKLRDSNPGDLTAEGAINTGFDPAPFSSRLPGYRWLKDHLKWMKNRFGDRFDDQPGDIKNPERLRNPFPAFFWNIQSLVGGRPLPIGGVEVLVGHDLAVVHEFAVLPRDVYDPDLAYARLIDNRFAEDPRLSASLFTATFCQVSGPDADPPGDWLRGEFSDGRCPEVNVALRCAVRAEGKSYRGCLLVGGSKDRKAGSQGEDLSYRIEDHIEAIGYLKFFCILLVNDAKVQYECAVAKRATKSIRQELDTRFRKVEDLTQAHNSSSNRSPSRNLVDALRAAHWADGELLDQFGQLVRTCMINTEQFEQIASQLMKPDNRWASDVRRRLKMDCADLEEARRSLRHCYKTTRTKIDALLQGGSDQAASGPPVRDKIFVGYSHKDGKKALEELNTHLPPALSNLGLFGSDISEMIWDDTKIKPGAQWLDSIKTALARTKAAILLVTPEFLTSKFINQQELPELLRAAKEEHIPVLWIHVRASTYKYTEIASYQFLHNPDEPLDGLSRPRRDKQWVKICKKIRETLDPAAD